MDSVLFIDTTQVDNIWEIGKPQKSSFDSAYSSPNAICTDLENNYISNNLSSFQLTIVSNNFGTGLLEFVHKYETDTGNAGGYLEISYDKGITWLNLVHETNWRNNFYGETDTIAGNIPAFTGSSDGWSQVSFYFLWYALTKKADRWPSGWGLGMYENPDTLLLRFNFMSNEKAIENQGWLIDDIRFQVWAISNSDSDIPINNYSLFYQPETRKVRINSNNTINFKYSVSIFDIQGRSRLNFPNSPEILDVSDLNTGVYIVCIYSDCRKVLSERIIIY
jgi:hypothetical protein